MIILASGSSRRIELLKDANIEFKVLKSKINEVIDEKLTPKENAMKIAREKALDVFQNNKDDLVIAADTLVVLNNQIFGKPKDENEALEMLTKLNGKTHSVITGVAIMYKEKEDVFYSLTKVTFKNLKEEEILEYIKTKEPMDKAGAYAIQGLGKDLVETFDGDFLTVVGLPLKEVLVKIKKIQE